jgi:hypothetical protein
VATNARPAMKEAKDAAERGAQRRCCGIVEACSLPSEGR